MAKKKNIGLKFCGGCNPSYDRGLTAEKIRGELDGIVNFVNIIDDTIDMVLSIQGCDTSCADLQPFEDYDVKIVKNINDAEEFIKSIKEKYNS